MTPEPERQMNTIQAMALAAGISFCTVMALGLIYLLIAHII